MFKPLMRLLAQLGEAAAYMLAPEPEPAQCEYRRPASITCYRHGMRRRDRLAESMRTWETCPQVRPGRRAA